MDIPKQILERIDDVIAYVGNTTYDYLVVKRQLINNLPNEHRALFSARHQYTKKHQLNAFDSAVIAYWESKTGVRLEIPPEKIHNPDWIHDKKKGWALALINQTRNKEKHEQPNLTS